jgi:hypothetical protein
MIESSLRAKRSDPAVGRSFGAERTAGARVKHFNLNIAATWIASLRSQ